MSRRFYAILSVLLMVAGSTMIVTSQVDAQETDTQDTSTDDEAYNDAAVANGDESVGSDSAAVEASDITVTVTKQAIGDLDPASPTEFAFTVNGEPVGSLSNGESFTVPYQPNMVISETSSEGWSLLSFSCLRVDSRQDFDSKSIVLLDPRDDGSGEHDIDCTFVNRRLVTVNITKSAPDDPEAEFVIYGGSETAVVSDGDTASFSIDVERFVSFSENRIPGWQGTFECPDKVPPIGPLVGAMSVYVRATEVGPINCTLTNTPADVARLIIEKEVPAGAPVDQQFTFEVGTFNTQAFNLAPGEQKELVFADGDSVQISELSTAGWLVPSVGNGITCSGATPSGAGAGAVRVDLTVGVTVTCTFTNTPAIPLTITKQILDGAEVITTPLEFFFEVAGPGQSDQLGGLELNAAGAGSSVGVTNADPAGGVVTLAAGQPATVLEDPVGGFAFADASCTGTVNGALATSPLDNRGFVFADPIPVNETAVSCIVTNAPSDGGVDFHTVTVTKKVVGAGAPAESFYFEAYTTGPDGFQARDLQLVDGASFAVQTLGYVEIYEELDELSSAWTGAIECVTDTGEAFDVDPEIDEDSVYFTIRRLDQDLSCEFTNTWAPDATLTIVKQGPAGGPAQEFTFRVDEGERDYRLAASTPIGSVQVGIAAGASVRISEDQQSGWQLDSATCLDRGDDLGVTLAGAQVQLPTIEMGADIVCTFVNAIVEPVTVRLTKEIAGVDDGSTFLVQGGFAPDQTVQRMGHGDTALFEFPFRGEFVNINLREEVPVGWGNPGFACDVGLVRAEGSFFSLAGVFEPGTVIDCTLTNQRVEPATITVKKLVDGDVVADEPFAFAVGNQTVTVAAGDSVDVLVHPGSVQISELVPVGWRVGSSECAGVSTSSFTESLIFFEVASGDAVTCTFTNVPVGTATLQLTKVAEGADADEVFVFSTPGGLIELRAGETASVAVPLSENRFVKFDSNGVSFSELFDPDWRVGEVVCPGWQVEQTNSSVFFFDDLLPAGVSRAQLTAEPGQSQSFVVSGDIRVGSEINCTVTNVAAVDKLVPGGDPDAPPFTGQPTEIMITACPGGTATFIVNDDNLFVESLMPEGVAAQQVDTAALTAGSLVETPAGSGVYMGSFLPTDGLGVVEVTVSCPDGSVETKELAAIWLDPFGQAVDCAGAPVAGATATLLRSPTGAAGSYVPATGVRVSGILLGRLDPTDVLGVNPQTTTAAGQYGWDVEPSNDFWLVEVAYPGQPTQSFGPIQVPPEVFNADVTFAGLGDCTDPDGGGGSNGGGTDPDGGSDTGSGSGSGSTTGSTSVTRGFTSQTVPVSAPSAATAAPAASQPRGLAVTGVESNLQAMIGFLITGMGVLSAGAARRRRSDVSRTD